MSLLSRETIQRIIWAIVSVVLLIVAAVICFPELGRLILIFSGLQSE